MLVDGNQEECGGRSLPCMRFKFMILVFIHAAALISIQHNLHTRARVHTHTHSHRVLFSRKDFTEVILN
jgi:hypothetical protein